MRTGNRGDGWRTPVALTLVCVGTAGLALTRDAAAQAQASQGTGATAAANATLTKRGEYLVTIMGCNDCHTPWKMGPNGPEPDMTKMLSGHPAAMQLPPAPQPNAPWGVSASLSMTAWSGPWGVSYSANLTPDPETGLGKWTEQQFLDTLRSGRHLGRGRQILPPMPWPAYGKADDADLKAVFAYLRSIPAASNRVPEPQPAAAGAAAGQKK